MLGHDRPDSEDYPSGYQGRVPGDGAGGCRPPVTPAKDRVEA